MESLTSEEKLALGKKVADARWKLAAPTAKVGADAAKLAKQN
jgi:hypothetical protein